MHAFTWTALALLTVSVGGCGTDSSGPKQSTELIRAEAGCEMPGLSTPLRQTVVFLDARAIQPSADAKEFGEKNAALRDLLLSIADPGRIQSSGVTAFRERVSIAVVPADGSSAQLVFMGCPPGLSAPELADARKKSSAVGEFFTGDAASKLSDQSEAFTRQLIGALTAAGARAGGGTPNGAIADASFLTGVKSTQALLDAKDHMLRLILIADLSPLSSSGGFSEGVTAGRAAGGRFGLAEVDIVAPAGKPVSHKEFLRGWFLAQGANLASAGSGRVALATPVPRHLWRFEGQAAYPGRQEAVAIRVGDDGAGKLAGAWLTLRGTPDRATPMTGTITCSAADRCSIQSDDGGFAQAWNPAPGGEPKFESLWPFGGMRSFAFALAGDRLTGTVSDDSVYIGPDTNRNSIAIAATTKH
jgi:hypothetical protein